MATEDLKIRLIARDETKKAFASARQGISATSKAALSLKKAFIGLGVVGGIALAKQLSSVAKESIQFADSIGKTADKLGITTDALQEFRFAAEQSGVSIQTFDMAMQRFTRRAGEAVKGTGEAKDALQQLGIEFRDAEGNMKNSSDLLMDVAESMSRVRDPSERLRLAFKLFDSEGAALVNMLGQGKEGLQEFRDRAQELGIVMDEELIRNAEELNDRYNELSKTISTKYKSAVVEIVDLFANLGEIRSPDYAPPTTEAQIGTIRNLLSEARKELEEFEAGYLTILQTFQAQSALGMDMTAAIQGLAETYVRLRENVDGYEASLKSLTGEQEEAEEVIRTGGFQQLYETIKNLNPAYKKATGISKKFFDAQTQINNAVAEYNLTAEQEKILNDALVFSFRRLGDAGKESAEETKTAWQEAAEAMKGSMADAITDMAMGLNSFKDTIKSVGDMIARMIIKQKIAEPIAAGISGSIGDIDFGFSHSGGIVGRDTPTRIRKYHSGGIAGNEVPAILQKGEMVLTKEQQKAVGNQVVNVTYSPQVNALDPRTAATVIAQNAPTIVGVIRQAFNRNGTQVAI